jgi:hypothetical protein
MKRIILLAGFAMLMCVAASASDTCQACSGSGRLQQCIGVNGSTHCFCTVSNGKCSANGCPCHLIGADPPLAECFCPSKIINGKIVSTARTIAEVRAEKVKQYNDLTMFAPHQLIVVHTCNHAAEDQPNEVLGMIIAAKETGHPITFTTLPDADAPLELVGK